MTIPLVLEDPDLSAWELEKCCFCYQRTPYWYAKKDVAVCPECAKKHKVADVPSKIEWIKMCQERHKGMEK